MNSKINETEQKLEFSELRTILLESCLFSCGREEVAGMQWETSEELIRKNLKLTSEFLKILNSPDQFPASNFFNFTDYLNKTKPANTYLEEEEVWELFLCLKEHEKIEKFIRSRQKEYPELYACLIGQHPAKTIKTIEDKFDDSGKIKDNASSELHKIRKQKKKIEASVDRTITRVYRDAGLNGYLPDGMSITVRNGRVVIPVLAEHKRKLRGIIHDYSSTGSVVFIEPDAVLEVANQIQDLQHEEKKEVVRLLMMVSDEMRGELDVLKAVPPFLGLIDFTRAKALLARKMNGIMPTIGKGNFHKFYQGRHPLLLMQGKNVIPLDLVLSDQERILLISGPNAGGKSVALKTAGLFQYMLQCGLLIPVGENSELRLFDQMFIDIGDQQSLENDLSTYSSHLKNMGAILARADERSLVLIDEFGSGTDPVLGGAIAEAILESIVARNTWGIITTHYSNLKQFAENSTNVVNGAMLFDKENLKPFYILEQGRPGGSFALEVAQETGLPFEIIERAKQLIGSEAVSLEDILAKLDKERKELSIKLSALENEQQEAKANKAKYFELKEELDNRRRDLLEDASEKANQLLKNANKEIEKTIRHIKENRAEKKETRKVRDKLDQFKKEKLTKEEKQTVGQPDTFVINEFVEIKDRGVKGEILEIRGKDAIVLIGNIRTKVKLDDIAKAEGKSPASSRSGYQFDREFREVSTSIDIRGKRAEEAMVVVDKFIDNALVAGLSQVSILHGKGNGVLRKVVRDHLSRLGHIEKFEDEHIERGGDGVTVVYLE